MRSLTQKIIPFLIILLALVVVVFLLGRISQHRQIVDPKAARDAGKPIPVSVFVSDVAAIRPLLVGSCSTDSSRVVELSTPLKDLLVDRVYAVPGQMIEAGAPLVELDSREAVARVSLAKDRLAGLEEEVKERENVVKYFLNNRQAGQSLEIDYRRELISLVQAKGDLSVADDELEIARINLDRTRIVAPITGQVEEVVTVGEVARQNAVLARIRVSNPIIATCEFDITDYAYLRSVQNDGSLYFRGLEGQGFPATYLMEDSGSSLTDNLAWQFTINNSDNLLQANMTGTIRFTSDKQVLRVPSVSVLNRSGERAQIFVVNGDTVKLTNITVGQQAGGFTEVVSGLKKGQSVVVAGQLNLLSGDQVSVLDQRKVTYPYDS